MVLAPPWLLVLACSLLPLLQATAETTLVYDGKVHVLTESNFSASIRKYSYTFVEFYAPGCPACVQLEPEWKRAATIARTYDVPMAKVDVSTEAGGKLAQEHGIESTPTMLLFRGDPAISAKYSGNRDSFSITDWLGFWVEGEVMARPDPTEKGVNKDWAPMARLKVLGVLSGEEEADKHLEELVDPLAFMLNPSEPQAVVPVGLAALPASEAAKLNITCAKLPCLVVFRDYEFEGRQVLTYEEEKKDLKLKTRVQSFMAWLAPKKVPTLIPASEETEKLFLKENAKPGRALAIFFGTDESFAKEVHKLAAELSPSIQKLKWVHATQNEFGEGLAGMVGLQAAGFPEFLIWQFGKEEEDDRVFKLTKQEGRSGFPDDLSEDVGQIIRSFVEGWQAGSLKAEQDPVLALTSKSFEKIVFDKSKDVLVEFYAPWCGHCKSLVPEYKAVARHYESDQEVAIVKMDATAHKHKSAKVKSFPTLMIYTASNKGSPITLKFEAGRDKQGIIDLVEKHRSTGSKPAGEGTCAAGDDSCSSRAKSDTAKPAAKSEDDDDDDMEEREF